LSSVYDQRNYGVSVELRKPLNSVIVRDAGISPENVDIFNVTADASPQIQAEVGSTLNSQILSSVVFDRRDNALLTRKGQRFPSPYVAGGFLGGDVQVYGWDLEGSQYFHLPKDLISCSRGSSGG